jgi:hypothetical protein
MFFTDEEVSAEERVHANGSEGSVRRDDFRMSTTEFTEYSLSNRSLHYYYYFTGGTNHHPGNKRYRKMVEDRKVHYIHSKRLDKPLVALEIIRTWRSQDPPGRFLRADDKTGLWTDVGDKKAREKTSQALREKAPTIRKQEEDHNKGSDDEEGDDGDEAVSEFVSMCIVKKRLYIPRLNEKLTALGSFFFDRAKPW